MRRQHFRRLPIGAALAALVAVSAASAQPETPPTSDNPYDDESPPEEAPPAERREPPPAPPRGEAPREPPPEPPPRAQSPPSEGPAPTEAPSDGEAPISVADEEPGTAAPPPQAPPPPADDWDDEGGFEIEVNAGPAASTATTSDAPETDEGSASADGEPAEITIVGVRAARAPGSAYVIRKATLERTEYDDPHAVLMSVPGVYVRTEDGMGLRPNIGLRGVISDRSKKVTLMEDGVLLGPAPYSAPAAYYFPLVTRFTQMRVVKGPSAIQHGPQTVGGAIDFVTRPIPAEDSGEVDIAAGQYAYGKLHAWAGTSTEKLGVLIEGVHLRNDGFKQLPDGGDTGFYRNEVVFRGSYVPNPRSETPSEFTLKLSYSDELSNETYLGLTDEDFRDNPLQRYGPSKLDQMKWHRTGVVLSHQIEPVRNFRIQTTVYRHDLARRWRKINEFGNSDPLFDILTDPEDAQHGPLVEALRGTVDDPTPLFIGPNEREYVSQGVQTRMTYKAATGPIVHSAEWGLRLHYDRIERHHTQDGFAIVGGDVIPIETLVTDTTAFNEAWTEAGALHAVDAITWGPLTVTPGIRAEVMRSAFIDRDAPSESRGTASVVLPGGGLYYAITEQLGALAGVYRGFSPPPPGSDSTTGPELSVNYEAGARYTRGRARAEIIGYYNDYSNLTDVCTLSSGCRNTNLDRQFDAGKARIYGVESQIAHDIQTGDFVVPTSASYTLALTEFLNEFQSADPIFGDVLPGDELPYVPRHQANVLVGLEHATAGGYLTGTYIAPMREQAGSQDLDQALTTDEQITFDLGAYYRPIEWLKIYGNIRNVLDSHYIVSRRPFGARPNAPRWIQVGAKATF